MKKNLLKLVRKVIRLPKWATIAVVVVVAVIGVLIQLGVLGESWLPIMEFLNGLLAK